MLNSVKKGIFKKTLVNDDNVNPENDKANVVTDESKSVNQDKELPLHMRKGRLPKIMVSKTHEHLSHVITLRAIITILVVLLLMSLYTTSQIPKQILLKVSPVMESGATMKVGEYPKAAVLSDVQYLWLAINRWENTGEEDAKKLLWRYQNFISPEFRADLERQYEELAKTGVMSRKRIPAAVPEQIFQYSDRVVQINNDTWKVFLDITLEETLDDIVVRKPTYRYYLMVQRYESDLTANPLGLRIVGYSDEPKRIKD